MKWQKQTVALIISVVLLAMFSGIMSAMDTDGIENRSSSNSGQSMSPVIAEEEITVGAFSKGVSIASTTLQPGWPKATGDDVSSSPALGDIDGDGDIEIVVGSDDGQVYAWHHDGTLVTGWPKATGDTVDSSPALGDIDGDGDIEIVVGSDDEQVYAWHHDGTLVIGWPKTTGDDVDSSPALGDIDGDGDIEIVVGSDDEQVYAWHHDGTLVTGWPKATTTADREYYKGLVTSSPALGDIDGDGDIEIVVGCSTREDKVYAWHHDGTLVTGWPKTTYDGVASSPALGDIDGDGDIEIVVSSSDDKLYAWHHDGTSVYGWPKAIGGGLFRSSPALGDIDGDGDIEIVVGSNDGQVYAWHYDGTLVTGWPKATDGHQVTSSPALGDIDGDGDIEIVVGSSDGKVYAWHYDGTLVTGWPKATDYIVTSSPALGDIDGDGDIEIVVGSRDGKVYAWDCPGTYDPGNIEWGTFHHDVRRTGLYGTQPPSVKPKIISIATDKSSYTIGETVNLRIEINSSDEYPVVTVLELELKEPSDMPDLLYKSPHFIMEPPVFQWNATESIHINESMWVSGGKYSLIATLKESTTGRVICKDTAWFEIDDLPEKKRVELEIP
jgi:hypothetical protein